MKLNWKDFLRKCQFPLLLAAGTMPIPLLILNAFAPDCLPVLWMFPAAYVLLAWLCIVLPGKIRLIVGLIGSSGIIMMGVRLLPVAEDFLSLLIPLCYAVLLLFSLRMGGWSRETEISPTWLAVCLVCHIVGQIMVNVANRSGLYPIYLTAAPFIMACFVVCALLCFLSLNRTTMHGASMGRQRIPVRMRRRNIAMTILLLALVIFIAALPEVIRAVEAAWQKLLQLIITVLMFLSQFLPQSSPGGGGGGDMDMSGLGGEAAEPSLLAVIMEKIMTVIAVIAIVALLIFVVVKLYRKLKHLMKYLAQRLSMFAHTSTEDFEDEITDTRDDGEQEHISLLDNLRKRLTRVDEKSLTPAQRIRYRYLRLMLKHPEWHASQTARENLPPSAASLYERARYSEENLSAEEAEAFADSIHKL